MGNINKGTIASISGNTARVVPSDAGAKPTAKITIPWHLLPSLSAGNINVPKGDVTARGISLSGHTHGGVETGSGSTKKPN